MLLYGIPLAVLTLQPVAIVWDVTGGLGWEYCWIFGNSRTTSHCICWESVSYISFCTVVIVDSKATWLCYWMPLLGVWGKSGSGSSANVWFNYSFCSLTGLLRIDNIPPGVILLRIASYEGGMHAWLRCHILRILKLIASVNKSTIAY